MTSLSELAQGQADLTPDDVDWLHLLLGDWQLLADLSFADLVLLLPLHDGARGGFLAAAQLRPTTGPTVYHDDIVGTLSDRYEGADLRDDVKGLVDGLSRRGLVVDAAA